MQQRHTTAADASAACMHALLGVPGAAMRATRSWLAAPGELRPPLLLSAWRAPLLPCSAMRSCATTRWPLLLARLLCGALGLLLALPSAQARHIIGSG